MNSRNVLYIVILFFLCSCKNGNSLVGNTDGIEYKYATLITAEQESLIGKNYSRVAVDASVYKGLMDMMGVGDKCLDFSRDIKPDVEKIASSKADLLLLSYYDGIDIAKYERLGIPIIKCTDFLESSPLARAEWMRFFGRLWGVGEKADSLFEVVESNYNELYCKSQSITSNDNSTHSYGSKKGKEPLVFFDFLYGNIWYQPLPKSTTGKLVSDAGGQLPFKDNQKEGVQGLSVEQVLFQAKDADFWLIRAYGKDSLSFKGLAKINPAYSQFKAFKEGNVFVCYTDKTHYFEETAFRPDWLLKDFKAIFASKIGETKHLRYFCKLR